MTTGTSKKKTTKVRTKSKSAESVLKASKVIQSTKIRNMGKVKLVPPKVAAQMLKLLCRQYPDAECELEFASDFQLLTAVILSAQCTDVQVNKVTQTLFKRFPTPHVLAQASLEEIKQIVRPTGYFNAKAQNIQSCAQVIVENFAGVVPNTLEELITLPGVGRKTANCVLGVCHAVPGWTVDTHVKRLSQRLGLTKNSDPLKIEQDLQKLFPHEDWSKLSITLIWHGRRLCFARNPNCLQCPINHLCPASLV